MTVFANPARETPQNWGKLADYLAKEGFAFDPANRPRQFASGFGNLNYLIEVDGKPAVLRRPPEGKLPPGANDMKRESCILSSLPAAFPLAPRALLYCESPEILGAHFFIMEYRPGLVIGGQIENDILDAWPGPDDIGTHLGRHLIGTLCDLHDVRPGAVGLDSLGRPEGFLDRTLTGWLKRAQLAWQDGAPAILGDLSEWLEARKPAGHDTVLIHNDYKLDNVILDPATLDPVAVIDWDMGTQGAPLYDLAVLLSYWTEKDDPEAMQMLGQMPTAGHGFPTREEAAALYAGLSGRDLADFAFYRVLAALRLGVVFKQLHRKFETGVTRDSRYAEFDTLAEGLLHFGKHISDEKFF